MKSRYFTILIACFIIIAMMASLFVYNVVGRHLNGLQQDMIYEGLASSARDIRKEISIMNDISLDITLDANYRYSYVSQQKYYEYALLRDFVGFYKRLNSAYAYFLLYNQDSDGVFSSDGYKWSFSVYAANNFCLSAKDADRLRERLCGLERSAMIPLDDRHNLICFPIWLTENSERTRQAVIVFVANTGYFTNTILRYSDLHSCHFQLSYEGSVVADSGGEYSGSAVTSYEFQTHVGSFLLHTDYALYGVGFMLRNIRVTEAILLIAILLIVSAMGVLLSTLGVKPFEKLLLLLSPNSEPGSDILDKLEKTIVESRAHFDRNADSLRELLIRQLLYDGVNDRYANLMRLCGIDLDGECFCIALMPASDKDPAASQPENLSNNSCAFYSAFIPVHSCYAVIIVPEDEAYLPRALEMLESFHDNDALPILSGDTLYQKTQIPASYAYLAERYSVMFEGSDAVIEGSNKTIQNLSFDPTDLGAQLIRFVTADFANPDMSLKMIADHFNLTANHCSIVFRRVSGVPYKQYLTTLRLTEAKRLLEETDLNVHEIAELVGYGKASNFIKKFSEEFGDTPLAYRLKFKHDKANIT